MAEYVGLANIQNSQDDKLTNILLNNFISFYDWGFIDKGGYVNIQHNASGIYGGNKSKLSSVKDPNYQDGQVWQTNRTNLMWETGVSVGTPISISGVFVTGVFRATGNIQQPYNIDYKNGRVIFDTKISTSANVTMSYSRKYLNVIPSDGVPWIREIQQYGNRVENSQFSVRGSGDWVQLGQSRVQIPALLVEVVPSRQMVPYQLGGGQESKNDVLFHIITDKKPECSNIVDTIVFQNDRTIDLYDNNKIMQATGAPLNHNGYLNPGALPSGLYPNLLQNYPYRKCFMTNTTAQGITQLAPDLYIGTVRCTAEVRPF